METLNRDCGVSLRGEGRLREGCGEIREKKGELGKAPAYRPTHKHRQPGQAVVTQTPISVAPRADKANKITFPAELCVLQCSGKLAPGCCSETELFRDLAFIPNHPKDTRSSFTPLPLILPAKPINNNSINKCTAYCTKNRRHWMFLQDLLFFNRHARLVCRFCSLSDILSL